ncbi:hypothetical protein AGOR_G00023960 [Albula goreensis]|uniref:Cystatin-B n=1 Tax=Albula goreensis TaxID=1534307 RepID=A0A8T3E1N2_9TELE|nr:hypothetical protein AGOR_G00023960 [Albula goreensis]
MSRPLGMPMCGGTGDVMQATPELQSICDEVKPHAEEKAGKKFDVFKAHSYKTQVVAGTNYFVKVHVGGDDYVHLRIFKPLPHTGQNAEMHSLQVNKAHLDVLEYF